MLTDVHRQNRALFNLDRAMAREPWGLTFGQLRPAGVCKRTLDHLYTLGLVTCNAVDGRARWLVTPAGVLALEWRLEQGLAATVAPS